jgi:hypothetical protein
MVCLKKLYALITLLCFLTLKGHCQLDTTLIGAYRNCVDFENNKPLYPLNFKFEKLDNPKIPELYDVIIENDSRLSIKNDNSIWGIYDGKYFYLNGQRIGMTHGYIRVPKKGNYAYFKGIPVKSLEQQERINNSAFMLGMTGAVIGNSTIDKENRDRIHYVLNFKTGMINLLTRDYMLRILEPYSDLLYSFQQEMDNNSIELLKNYLDLLNMRIEKNTVME